MSLFVLLATWGCSNCLPGSGKCVNSTHIETCNFNTKGQKMELWAIGFKKGGFTCTKGSTCSRFGNVCVGNKPTPQCKGRSGPACIKNTPTECRQGYELLSGGYKGQKCVAQFPCRVVKQSRMYGAKTFIEDKALCVYGGKKHPACAYADSHRSKSVCSDDGVIRCKDGYGTSFKKCECIATQYGARCR
jgi:hypothetical protein